MKIIKLGKKAKQKMMPKKHTCDACYTEFEYDSSDVNMDRDGRYVICPNPTCRVFIQVN